MKLNIVCCNPELLDNVFLLSIKKTEESIYYIGCDDYIKKMISSSECNYETDD